MFSMGGAMKTTRFGVPKRAAGIVMLALLGGAAVVASGFSPGPVPQDWDKIQVKAVPVTGGIHMIVGPGGNIGILPGRDGVLLIDSAFPQLHDKIVAALAPLAGGGRVRFVLNTNWHYDHALGNELFRKDGAVVVGHVTCVERMGREQFHDVLNEKRGPFPPAGWPEVTFTDSLALRFNGEDIQVLHIPDAHSDADAIFIFKQANVIHTGDLFFSAGYPYIDITNGGSIDGMIAASDHVLALAKPDTMFIPGHGPAANRARLERYRAMMATVRDRVAKLAGEGKTLEETLAAKPTADLDAEWAKGMGMPPDRFVALVYKSLPRR
jgi:glyoxylase-like metal-dependent hydrolase (beta-lactamase superfamily II)